MLIEVTDIIAAEEQQVLLSGLTAYNRQFIDGIDGGSLGVYARNDSGELLGGLIGKRNGDWLCIKYLWVGEACRGKKIGTRLIAAAEERSRAWGCRHMLVNTTSFQALPFYQKCGFWLQSTLEDFPCQGIQRHYLTKRLSAPDASAPAHGEQ